MKSAKWCTEQTISQERTRQILVINVLWIYEDIYTPTPWQTNIKSWINLRFVGVLMLSSAHPTQSKAQVLWESLRLPASMFYFYFNASCQPLGWQTPSQTGLSETAGRLRSSHMCRLREEVMPLCAQSSRTCLSSSRLLKASSTTWKDYFFRVCCVC